MKAPVAAASAGAFRVSAESKTLPVGPATTGVTSALTYAIVTPARNERDNLERLAESVLAQDHPPVSWLIVDDGSDDGMRAVADDLARRHSWIVVVGTGEDAANLAMGRRRGRDLLAFRRGLSSLPTPVDVFVKVDADTSFDPDYFALLLDRFVDQPELGIAGGTCYEVIDGKWQRIKVSGSHPRGASRAYRWALLNEVFALEPEMGWDGVDEVMAELRGYRTAGFADFGFRHHRKVGEREGRLRAGAALGRQAWYMGYRPSYLVLRALYRARENFASMAMVWGYVWSAASGAPQCPNPTVTRRVREGQRLRVVMRRGGWA
jgi:biofilm PGA synthesis N-glycosyltransferase PgaC